jgi:hypothetical protein
VEWGRPWGAGSEWGETENQALLSAVQIATNQVLTIWSAYWNPLIFAPEIWELLIAGEGSVPLVILVEQDGPTSDRIVITTDQAFNPGIEYEIGPPVVTKTPGPIIGGTFVAKPVSITSEPDHDLLDVEQPPFEATRITPGGDHGLAAGYITYRKLILDALLTIRGSIPWAPEYGSDTPHKQLRPVDLSGEEARTENLLLRVPGTRSVNVRLSWDGRQMVFDVDARADSGSLREEIRL